MSTQAVRLWYIILFAFFHFSIYSGKRLLCQVIQGTEELRGEPHDQNMLSHQCASTIIDEATECFPNYRLILKLQDLFLLLNLVCSYVVGLRAIFISFCEQIKSSCDSKKTRYLNNISISALPLEVRQQSMQHLCQKSLKKRVSIDFNLFL